MTQPLKWHACVIILAGGKSTRMGSDKSLAAWDGIPLVQRTVQALQPLFAQLVLSTNAPDAHRHLNVPMEQDRYPDCGPMGGIASALALSVHDENFVVACDIPVIPVSLIAALRDDLGVHDAAVPVCESRYEPLFAWYRKSTMRPMIDALRAGDLKLQRFLESRAIATRAIPPGTLLNINTPEDLAGQIESGAAMAPERMDEFAL